MSWKPEVQTGNTDPKWYGNALRFATKDECESYVFDLAIRWTAVRDGRSTECDDPVTHRWDRSRGDAVSIEKLAQAPASPPPDDVGF